MKALKVILILVGIVILLIVAAGAYVKLALPDTGKPPVLSIKSTPERLENGRYLANHVAACMDCHSSRDWTRYAGPMKQAGFGGGGKCSIKKWASPAASHQHHAQTRSVPKEATTNRYDTLRRISGECSRMR